MAPLRMSCPDETSRTGRLTRRHLLAVAASAPFISPARAAYPDRPLRVIVPGAPGGLVDLAARAIGDAMQRELGQPWLIQSKPGANGIIAAKAFLEAPADDNVLYLTALAHVLLPFVAKVPFDVLADFQPVAMVGLSTFLLCVPPDSPADTVAGFVRHAQVRPGKLSYLNSGNATASHLLPEMLNIRYGLNVTSVYYKALSQGVTDLMGGRLDLGLVGTGVALPLVLQGRLKVIAQVGQHRVEAISAVATLAEQGLADLSIEALLPLYSRASMPASTAARINKAVSVALADLTTRERLANAYIEPMPMDPADVGATMRREHDRLGSLIQQLGIKADDST